MEMRWFTSTMVQHWKDTIHVHLNLTTLHSCHQWQVCVWADRSHVRRQGNDSDTGDGTADPPIRGGRFAASLVASSPRAQGQLKKNWTLKPPALVSVFPVLHLRFILSYLATTGD